MNNKKPNIIKDKSFAFALRIVKVYKFFSDDKKFVLSKQLLKRRAAIGALVHEAEHAENKTDFINEMAIAQKEANETDYWIELLYQSEYLKEKQYKSINEDIKELIKISASTIEYKNL